MTRNQPAPWKPLAALTAGVVLLHFALLEAAPASLRFEEPVIAHRFITRTVVMNPPAPAKAPAAAAKPLPAEPPPRARPAPRAPAPGVIAAVPAPAVEPAAAAPTAPPAAEPAPAQTEASALPQAAASAPAPTVAATVAAAPSEPASVTNPPASYAVPGSMRLQYTVSGVQRGQPMAGVAAELLWLQDGEKYQAQLEFRFLFRALRSQSSTGRITRSGLEPERFTDRRRTEVAAHFERDKAKISFSANTPDAPLLAGAQDRLSLFFQLGSLVAGDPRAYPPGTSLRVQTVGANDADTWVITVGAEELLQLPAGELRALRFTRNPRREFDQKVEVWLAPSMGYLPVKLRITDAGGDYVEQQLRASGTP